MFVGAITLVIAISSQIRRGIAGSISNRGQRRQRFLRNCLYSDVCDPNHGRRRDTIRSALLAATCAGRGLIVCLLAIFYVYPIIDVPNCFFAAKIIAVALVANHLGVTIFTLNYNAAVRLSDSYRLPSADNPAIDLEEYQLGDFVRMKGAHLFLERRLSILRFLHDNFAGGFYFFFPANSPSSSEPPE